MNSINKDELIKNIKDFELPKYNEIPNVGLYLEQTAKYITEYLSPLQINALTGSMISNYVKKGLVSNPVKKQYDREQIAYLIFIAVAKTVLSMEDIKLLIGLQKRSYEPMVAYNYFEAEFKNVLSVVFGIKDNIDEIGISRSEVKILLRNTIVAVAHKVYLDKCFAMLHGEPEENNEKNSI